MATAAASAKTVIFGLLSKYKIRDVQQMSMQRFVETKGKQNQDEFLAIMRCDGNLLGAGQTVVSYLVQAAS
jgi:HK97 family phage major capsid protein